MAVYCVRFVRAAEEAAVWLSSGGKRALTRIVPGGGPLAFPCQGVRLAMGAPA